MPRNRLCFEDVEIGQEIPSLSKHVDSVSMMMYGASTWDFHKLHHDKDYANSKGMKSPVLDGQQMGAFLAQQVLDWTGTDSTLKRLAFRYTGFVFAGDDLTCKGQVADVRKEREETLVECELWIENQEGNRVLDRGKAILSVPSRASS